MIFGSIDPPLLDYFVQLGDASVCGPGLSSSWTLCSAIPMGSARGTVNVHLPTPVAVASVDVLPWISISGEAASQVSVNGCRP